MSCCNLPWKRTKQLRSLTTPSNRHCSTLCGALQGEDQLVRGCSTLLLLVVGPPCLQAEELCCDTPAGRPGAKLFQAWRLAAAGNCCAA